MQLFLNNESHYYKLNLMKIIFLFVAVFALSSLAISQTIDKRLLASYTQSELLDLKNVKASNYEMLIYAIDHSIYVSDIPEGKDVSLTEIDYKENQSYLDLGLIIKKENQYFKIKNQENKMLIVKSEWVLLNELNTKK